MKLFSKRIWITLVLVFIQWGGLMISSARGDSGPLIIEKIECEGNQKTSCDFIQAQTDLQVGQELQEERAKESQLRLELLGYFDDVSISLSKGSKVGYVQVKIAVHERSGFFLSLNSTYLGGWRNYVGTTIIDTSATSKNFSGNGDALSVRSRNIISHQGYRQTYLLRTEYTRPFLTDPRVYFSLGIAGGVQRDPILTYDGSISPYGYYNVYPSGDYTTNTNAWADIALGYKLFEYSFVAGGLRYYTGGSPFSTFFQLGWDSQDNVNFPTEGSRLTLSGDWNQYAFYRSEYSSDYLHLEFSIRKHWQIFDSHILTVTLGRYRTSMDPAFDLFEEQTFAGRYSYQFKRHASGSFIQNGSVYIEPGFRINISDRDVQTTGLKVGTVLETKFGMIGLAFLARWF